MSRPLFLVDVDGVLALFDRHYAETAARVTGRPYAEEHVTTWQCSDALGLSSEEEAAVVAEVLRPGWCASLPPCPQAAPGLTHLLAIGDVHVVTSPWPWHPTWAGEREAWLLRHFGLGHRQVTHTHAKHLVRGDCLIDDKPSHVREWQAAHPGGLGLLWDTRYNRGEPGLRRVTSWEEVAGLVTALVGAVAR